MSSGRDAGGGRLFAISDLHIREPDDAPARGLLAFLEQRLRPGDRLIVVGDLFDWWYGGFGRPPRDGEPILAALERVGVVDYVEGNHDFRLGPALVARPAFRHHPEGLRLQWSGLSIDLRHGDLQRPALA